MKIQGGIAMRKRTIIKLLICLIIIVAGIGAYSARSKTSTNQQSITAVGSTALQPLVEAASEQYTGEHSGIFINVQGVDLVRVWAKLNPELFRWGNSDLFAQEKAGINPQGD